MLPTRLLAVATWGAVAAVAASPPRPARDRPNFVVFFVDDLGYGDVGFTGHPTTRTPNIDKLAFGGKVLTTWYSGCAVCTGSRAALMTGRQYTRIGIPAVVGPVVDVGLPPSETTVAEELKAVGYATAAVGKWHLGQREVYLPANHGFDHYLGIPYSDDMGAARATNCSAGASSEVDARVASWSAADYEAAGLTSGEGAARSAKSDDPGGKFLPLVRQENGKTTVVEQPLDFSTLAQKYNDFAVDFVKASKDHPFFLYMPFSHVHATAANQPLKQYAGCAFKNATCRGPFGDALAEVDWMVGNVHRTLQEAGVEENTLIIFTSDNGPWLINGLAAGSSGLLTGQWAGYWNTGKGSTWEGGIREPAFAYWKGQVEPHSRSSEVVSSLDVLPTLSALAGAPPAANRTIDGRDMSAVLLTPAGLSPHDFLFFYGGCAARSPVAVRHGQWKAHFCTGPGLGGCEACPTRQYPPQAPLIFDVEADPSERLPLNPKGGMPKDAAAAAAVARIAKAYAFEVATFVHGTVTPAPDGPGEGPGKYGVCCDRSLGCDCDGAPSRGATPSTLAGSAPGFFGIGSKQHHDSYHAVTGEHPPLPPTLLQDELV